MALSNAKITWVGRIFVSLTMHKLSGGGRSCKRAYLMVSLQFNGFASDCNQNIAPVQADFLNSFKQHPCWSQMSGWKHRLNNLQLIIPPYIYYCLIKPWLKVFDSWYLRVGFSWLIAIMNEFVGYVPTNVKLDYCYFSSA